MNALLTDTQARVIRNATVITVHGESTRRAGHLRGDRPATFRRLYLLGLLDGPYGGAALTDLGLKARDALNGDSTRRRVIVSKTPCDNAAIIDQPESSQAR